MPATGPPADLSTFPSSRLPEGSTSYRIFLARDPGTGEPRTHWFFATSAATGSTGGRFDLPAPDGSCYLSDRFEGAWLEVFRDTGLVERADVERRRLLRASRTAPVDLADLTSAGARAHGVTLDLATGDDYEVPRRWAAALRRAGRAGLVGKARHDPTGGARTVVVFGAGGARHLVRGWRTDTAALDDAVTLARVAAFGTGVLDRPRDVTVRRPPAT